MEMGRFSDLSEEEFVKTHLKYRPSSEKVREVNSQIHEAVAAASLGTSDDESYDDLPASFSWTEPQPGFGKVVTPVHNQQDICASCWAFVSADSIAGRYAVLSKRDVEEMSVKQIMVCDHEDNGCNTGNMYTAYDWIGENGGLSTRKDYDSIVPGEVQDDEAARCAPEAKLSLTTPGMCDLKMTAGNRALMVAIKESGPVAIGINANNLQFYESGIIDAASCPPAGRGIQSINHAAIVVGWGEENGKKYWLVKNSYGEDFGENGYFRLERERPNMDTLFGTCGLLFESVYPVVTEAGVELGEPELQCTEGSVFKKDYYRNEDDNPGASLQAMAEADAAVGAALGRMVATASLGSARTKTKTMPSESATSATMMKGASVLVAGAGVAVLVARRRGGAWGGDSEHAPLLP